VHFLRSSAVIYTTSFAQRNRDPGKNAARRVFAASQGRSGQQEPSSENLVSMKQVPQKDAPLKLNEAGPGFAKTFLRMNEPDAYALEEALRQKEKHGGE